MHGTTITKLKLSFRLIIQRLGLLCMEIRLRFSEHFKHKCVYIFMGEKIFPTKIVYGTICL